MPAQVKPQTASPETITPVSRNLPVLKNTGMTGGDDELGSGKEMEGTTGKPPCGNLGSGDSDGSDVTCDQVGNDQKPINMLIK